MTTCASNPSRLEEDQTFKLILGYTVSLGPSLGYRIQFQKQSDINRQKQKRATNLKLSARLFVKAEEETFFNWFTQILNLTSRISILAKMC